MPGLAVILKPKYEKKSYSDIDEMAEVISHEKYYKKDVLKIDTFTGVRVHLNIINKDPQPVYNKEKTILVMFDGEIHNRIELKEKLLSMGHNIKDPDDAELVLRLYEEYGNDFVNELNGWFLAFIHIIPQKRTLIINDCFGIYGAYYTEQYETFLLATEIKSLLKISTVSRRINEKSISEYFHYNAVLQDRTLFKDIYRFPPGSIWTYQNGQLTKEQYFDINNVANQDKMNEHEFYEEGDKLFKSITSRYLMGDGVGMSLTGGWDTRAIMAVMNDLDMSIPCYTFNGLYRDSLDVKIGSQVAETCGKDYKVLSITNDFLDNFERYAKETIYISDGTADIFKSHEIYFCRIVGSLAPIRVTGQYGSQVFGGLFSLKKHKIDQRIYSKELLEEINKTDEYPYLGLKTIMDEIRWLWGGYLAIQKSQLIPRTPYTDKDLILFGFKAPSNLLAGSKLQQSIVKKNYQLALIPSDKGIYIGPRSLFTNLRDAYISTLVKMDKAYNWHSLPHLLAKIEPYLRWIGIQKLFIGNNQLVSYRVWLKNELRSFTENILLDNLTLSRSYYNEKFIKQMTTDHFSNKANYTNEIGKIISFELWNRLFID